MGRGLSDLQRQILCLAFEKGFVKSGEMIVKFWGLKHHKQVSKEAAYSSAHAVLSRTITRLWARALVVIWKDLTHSATAVTLTAEGEAMARSILTEDQKKQSNG